MAKKFFVAGNWKMNHGPKASKDFLEQFKSLYKPNNSIEVIIFPPAISWQVIKAEGSNISWGLQNIYAQDAGAFTGETSVSMAQEIGAQYVLVGHSERRQIFHESDSQASEKVLAIQQKNMIPVLCLGETLSERESAQTKDVILSQLRKGCAQVDFAKPFLIAYEPVWAIGTGKVATAEQAQEAHAILRAELTKLCGELRSQNIPILYGGSVKPDNATELSAQPDVDGFLVGGASLKADSFVGIIERVNVVK